MMHLIRYKLISLLTLLAILSVAFSSLWVGHAEAKLGIEICTAQGVKTVYIDAPDTDSSNQDHSSSPNLLNHCLVCAATDQDLIAQPQLQTSKPLIVTVPKQQFYSDNNHKQPNVLNPLNPRAPPKHSFS